MHRPPTNATGTSGHETATGSALKHHGLVQSLKSAAGRCDDYLARYGLEVTWSLHPLGLKMTARFGADKLERFVDWFELEHSNHVDLPLSSAEQYTLAGLSS